MSESFYDLLGVPEDASTEEIEAAYRRRLKETHPDVSDDDDAGERTRRLIEARDVLTDDRERERYDRLGHDRYVAATDGRWTVDTAGSRGTPGSRESATDGADEAATEDERTTVGRGSRKATARENAARGRAGETTGDAGRTGRRERWRRERRAAEAVHDERTGETDRREGPSERVGETATDDGPGRAADQGWAAGRSYAVRDTYEPERRRGRVVPSAQALGIFLATVVTYPILLFSAVFPPFPLVANVVVGVCLFLLIGYLQSLPRIAAAAFGTWSVLGPIALSAFEVGFLTLPGLIVLVGTWFPFGLSLLTWSVMRL